MNAARTGIAAAWGMLALAASCAPPVDGPVDHQRAIDREDGDRLAAQLARLPGVVSADVVLHRGIRDPLAVTPPAPTAMSAVLTVDDRADRELLAAAATRVVRAAVPELTTGAALPIEIHATVHRPVLVQVGPFSVEESSRALLKGTLALGCLTIAGLAALLAYRTSRARPE